MSIYANNFLNQKSLGVHKLTFIISLLIYASSTVCRNGIQYYSLLCLSLLSLVTETFHPSSRRILRVQTMQCLPAFARIKQALATSCDK